MNNDNLSLWNAIHQPPVTALRAINGGRLRGKTDINPQWRLKAMTEQFGPCGIGWKYELKEHWTEPGQQGEVMCFVIVNLYLHDAEGKAENTDKATWWSAPIPGIGGAMLVEKETGGLHSNDEAFKMATTDALSVAMKQIGMAADVYMGRWDGSKYRDVDGEPHPRENKATPQPPNKAGGEPATVDGTVAAITSKFAPRIGIKVDEDWYNTEDHGLITAAKAAKECGHRISFEWKWRSQDNQRRKYITSMKVVDQNGEIVHELSEGDEQ